MFCKLFKKGKTLIVPKHYPTIQAAVDAALPGDTIKVKKGTYYEEVTIDSSKSNITIKGKGMKTILNGSGMPGKNTAFTLSPNVSNVKILRFCVINYDASAFLINCANNCRIEKNIISKNNIGIKLTMGSINNLIIKNQLLNSDIGILSKKASNNTYKRNKIYKTLSCAISLIASQNETIRCNKLCNNKNQAIAIKANADSNMIKKNKITDNKGDAIMLEGSMANTIDKNKILKNKSNGINGSYISYTNISKNKTDKNKRNGILLNSSYNNTMSKNTAKRNGLNGILVEDIYSYSNTLSLNKLSKNLGDGIQYDGSSSQIVRNKSTTNNNNGIEINGSFNKIINNRSLRNISLDIKDNGVENIFKDNKYRTSNLPK